MSNNDQFACYECNRIKSLFKQICSADVAEGDELNGSEYFPITTSCGLRKLSLGTFAQLVGGNNNLPAHGLDQHDDFQGNANNGDTLIYSGGFWTPTAPTTFAGWELDGNNGTTPGTDFIGTTDNKALVFKNNNTVSGILNRGITVFGANSCNNAHTADTDLFQAIAIGQSVMINAPIYGNWNVAIGNSAMQNYGEVVAPDDLVIDRRYIITSVGDTDFTLVGASSNTVGDYFFATGTTTGTGTAVGDGSNNVAIGSGAFGSLQTARNNAALGVGAGAGLVHGDENIFIGTNAGNQTTVFNPAGNSFSTNSVFIGANTAANDINETNQIVIGYTAVGLGSNTTVIGNADTVLTHLKGSLTIGDTAVDASAIVELTSTTQGFLPPRMTALQAEAISSPTEGLLVYATDGTGVTITTKGWWGYSGATWEKLN